MGDVNEFRTKDLALAATLHLNGYEHERLEMLDRDAVWVFAVKGDLAAIVDDYQAEQLEVEPREYNKVLRRVRQQLFDFLDRNKHGSR